MNYVKELFMKNTWMSAVISLSIFIASCSGSKKAVQASGENEESSGKKAATYADKLGIGYDDNMNMLLLKESVDWLGVPYKYGGNTKKGTDCSGFAQHIYKTVYEKSLNRSCEDIYKQTKSIKQKNLEEGDLVFFKIEGNKISHVGIYLRDNKFIHASTKKGVLVDDLDNPYYKKHYYSSGKIK
jgi:murein DD-endopeptidase / murein LD-carboxypeptidase